MSSCNSENKELPAEKTVAENSIDLPQAKALIDSINLKFTEQVLNGDSVALASHYWPDAELLLSNNEPVKGTDVLPVWGGMIRMGVKHFTFQTTDVALGGNLLVETGTYEMKAEDQSLIDRGKYVVVWKNQNGEWKLFRDIGNTSLPAPDAK
jgi:ketosteroid isomerase-like protein